MMPKNKHIMFRACLVGVATINDFTPAFWVTIYRFQKINSLKDCLLDITISTIFFLWSKRSFCLSRIIANNLARAVHVETMLMIVVVVIVVDFLPLCFLLLALVWVCMDPQDTRACLRKANQQNHGRIAAFLPLVHLLHIL